MTEASAPEQLVALVAGRPGPDLCGELARWGCEIASLGEIDSSRRKAILGERFVLWLGPRVIVDETLRTAAGRFVADPRGRVLSAPHVGHAGGLRVPLGDRVVLSPPGSAAVGPCGPIALERGAVARLDLEIAVSIPQRVGEHLAAVNEESSGYASWAAGLGARPSWAALAWGPLRGTLRGCVGARGDRRRAFTISLLETFLWAATSAKLWEIQHPDREGPS